MKLKLVLLASFVLVPGLAPAQIDCTGGCTVYKYGLGHPADQNFRRPLSPFDLTDEDFQGSFAFIRSDLNNALATNCGPERDFGPIQGQIVLRERNGCVPTSEGPTGAGGCPVEIPLAVSGVTPQQDKTTWSNGAQSSSATTDILASSSATLGGTSNPANPQCVASNIRSIPATGTRYILPAARGGNGTKTYIQWLDTSGQGLYRHEDDSQFCCKSTTGVGCAAAGGFTEYPILLVRNCGIAGRIYQLLDTNDWIFDGGPGTRFVVDSEHQIPNQVHGVCTNNRFASCTRAGTNSVCTGAGTPHSCCTGGGAGTCGSECVPFADTCDFRERGIRQTRPANLASGFPDPTRCSTVQAVLRGTPNQYCTINQKYVVNGDPGADCGVWNFGFRPRPDVDCNGVEDTVAGPGNDLCPFLNEFDYFQDTDGDCSGAGCRGDECECSDQSQDGRVNVADLVAINTAIFDPTLRQRLCDGNNDLLCNVSDIVAANNEIFRPDSAACRHISSLRCGDSTVDQGEACDNGARCQGGPTPGAACNAAGANSCGTGGTCVRVGGDGCNSACRVEFGWTCTGSPSQCTQNP